MAEEPTTLASLRQDRRLTQQELADLVGAGKGSVRAWERGDRRPRAKAQRKLANALGVELSVIARAVGAEVQTGLDGHAVPIWLTHYSSLVHAAGRLNSVALDLVPGLFQTFDYANEVERSAPGATEEQIAQMVEKRMERQDPVHRRHKPLAMDAVIAEMALRSRTGGPDVMLPQLDYLVELADRTNITIRVMPDDGRSACVPAPFELLTKPDDVWPFMAVTFDVSGPWYHEGPLRLRPFLDMWDHVERIALSPEESVSRIQEIRNHHS